MDTNMVLNASFNELVFENRHKNYGAYQIRKRYRKNVWLSVLIAVSIFSSALFLYVVNIPKAVAAGIPKTDSVIRIIPIHIEDPNKIKKVDPIVKPPVSPPAKGPDHPDLNNVSITKDSVKTRSLLDKTATSPKGVVGGTGPVNGNPNPCTDCDTGKTKTPIVSETWDPKKAPLDPGIDAFFVNNVKYPDMAREGNIEGTVWLSFIVNFKGEIRDIKIAKSAHPWLDREVLRVANLMPKWIPVKDADKNVEYIYRKPVRFRLH